MRRAAGKTGGRSIARPVENFLNLPAPPPPVIFRTVRQPKQKPLSRKYERQFKDSLIRNE